ncbi:Dnaaf1 [Symbiodinium natans]|uniref:Dnaaf1 protein n=1 Tax=Symbiodinium natans TaxID=878477 RepID=A0A812Q4D1_9DINO|nr:Dnaaf1 [Symbiodinium natans]
MRLEGRGADRPTFTAVVSVLQADGRWRLSLGILEEMQASRLEADIATYREAIKTLEEDTYWSKALDMIDEVRTVRLRPDQETISAAMEVLQTARQTAGARRLEEELSVLRLKDQDVEGKTEGLSDRHSRGILHEPVFVKGSH